MLKNILSFIFSIIFAIFPSLKDIVKTENLITQLEFVSMSESKDYNISLKDNQGNVIYSNVFQDEDENQEELNLPSFYSAVNDGLVTPAKNQASTGACWAFAAISAAETSAVKKGITTLDKADYSEAHLTWFGLRSLTHHFSDSTHGDGIFSENPYLDGGNWSRSVFALARWSGVQLEENAPFNGFPELMGDYDDEDRYTSYAHLQNSQYIPKNDEDGIKKAILDNGSITCSYYHNPTFVETVEGEATYYQDRVANTNHTVAIVGWNDNFSKNNFKYTPDGDGAWLVKNSWGTHWGQDGYMWLSYYDTSLCDFVTYEMESADNYDNNYQYDGFGYKGWAFITGEETMSMANVFSPDSLEELKAVSFYTVQNDVDYTVSVYTGLDNGDMPTDGEKQVEVSGHFDYRGYYTVVLPKSVFVKPEDNYSVVVNITVPEGYNAGIALEYPDGFDGAHTRFYHGEDNQSYYTVGTDYTQWTDSNKEGYNNVCIKAFTNEVKLSLKGNSQFTISLGYLSGVQLHMNSDFILKQFYNDNAVYENGFVKLFDEMGNLLDNLEISFYADIDDSGDVNSEDYELLRLMVNTDIEFDDKEMVAADLNFDKKITKADLDLMIEYLKEKVFYE